MVKSKKSKSWQNGNKKGVAKKSTKARKINASTAYETCSEQLSPFGGLLALIKFLDLIDFKSLFDSAYSAPKRSPRLGHCSMVIGLLMLLFIGFDRIWHFSYVNTYWVSYGWGKRLMAKSAPPLSPGSKNACPVACNRFYCVRMENF